MLKAPVLKIAYSTSFETLRTAEPVGVGSSASLSSALLSTPVPSDLISSVCTSGREVDFESLTPPAQYYHSLMGTFNFIQCQEALSSFASAQLGRSNSDRTLHTFCF